MSADRVDRRGPSAPLPSAAEPEARGTSEAHRTEAPRSSSPAAPASDGAAPAHVPGTTPADRTRLASQPSAPRGSAIAETLLARHAVPSAREVYTRMSAAIERAAPSDARTAARAALAALEAHPEGVKVAAALYLNRRPETVTDAELTTLPRASSVDAEALVQHLAFWHAKPAAAEALAGMAPALWTRLARAFGGTDAPELEAQAIAYVRGTRSDRATWMIGGFVATLGDREGSALVAELARRQRGLALQTGGVIPALPDDLLDAPAEVTSLHTVLTGPSAPRTPPDAPAKLQALDHPPAAEGVQEGLGVERGNRRGALGELLRVHQLQLDPSTSGRLIVRGLKVMSAPPELRTIPTYEAALAWCRAQTPPVDEHMILRVTTQAGSFFAINRTEIDVALFTPAADGKLRPVRLENVKAGLGHAHEADQQNRLALATLADADGALVLVGPKDGVYEDIRAELDLRPEVTSAVELLTVGPKDDPRYQVALPLTGWDLSQLALRLP